MKLKRDFNGNFKLNKRFIPSQQKRFCRMDEPVKKQEKENRFLLSAASEAPVWRGGWQCWEKMLINEDALDLSWLSQGRAALLFNHDPFCLIGRNEEIFIRDKILYSEARIKPGEYLEDVKGGYLSNVSIGYEILEMSLEQTDNDEDIILIDRARILEISLVSVPADFETKIEQSLPNKNYEEDEEEETPAEEKERNRVSGIIHLAKRENIPQWRVDRAIQSGEAIESFISYVEGQRGQPQPVAAPAPINHRSIGGSMTQQLYAPNERDRAGNGLGLSQKELREYSIARLLRHQIDPTLGNCFEFEASQTLSQRLNRSPKGFFVPNEVFQRDATLWTGGASGSSLVPKSVGEPVEVLRSHSILAATGASFLEGLSGEVTIPQQDEGAMGQWLNEGGVLPEEEVSFQPLLLSPHSVGSIIHVTRKMLIMASENVALESFIQRDIAAAISATVQRASLHGGESANEPSGVMADSQVTKTDLQGNSLTYSDVLQLEASISQNNIPLHDGMAIVTSPQGVRQLRAISKDTGSGEFLMTDESDTEGASGNVLNYPVFVTTSLDPATIVLANWADLLIASFGPGLDLVVNPYGKGFNQGVVAVRGISEADTAVRRPASFAALTNFDIS